MNQQQVDSHQAWLDDDEYRGEYGSENAKLEIAVALADARALAGVTQRGLAERAGVSQAYVAKLERGGANPTIGNIGRLFAYIWMKPGIQPVPLDPDRATPSTIDSYMSELLGKTVGAMSWEGDLSRIESTSAREAKIMVLEGAHAS